MQSVNKSAVITRNVWILSIVSLFTDMASEMLYPVMPIYLKSIGFSVIFIGLLEGAAEAVAGLSKGYFGNMSDKMGVRTPFVRVGYGLSALSKPMLALWINPLWVFFARTTDRLGKGIRTGARDALLSDEATAETKGRVFGFHRSMDTMGAVIGPLLALAFLRFWPEQYRTLFLIAFFPGAFAILFTLLIREKKKASVQKAAKPGFLDFLHFWKRSPVEYKKLLGALLFFALFNSSDVFLLLKIKEAGWGIEVVIGIYVFYNLVYALTSYPMGILADRLGMKWVLISGLFVFALVYGGMAWATGLPIFIALFLLYGLYAAATEGVAKAWISNLCAKEDTATAIGTYGAFQSIAAMLASSMAGVLWYAYGAGVAFGLSAVAAVLAAAYLSKFSK